MPIHGELNQNIWMTYRLKHIPQNQWCKGINLMKNYPKRENIHILLEGLFPIQFWSHVCIWTIQSSTMPRLKTITHKQGLPRDFVTLFEQAGVCTTKTCIAKLTPSLKNITQFY
jgi:hypothetical protein